VVPTAFLVVVVVAVFAALGRSAMPRAERLPWTRWSTRDVLGNAAAGARRLSQLHQRNPMTPQRRTPFHR
jgi:hypothetical protein